MEISSLLKETFPSIYEESARKEIEKEGIIMELKAIRQLAFQMTTEVQQRFRM